MRTPKLMDAIHETAHQKEKRPDYDRGRFGSDVVFPVKVNVIKSTAVSATVPAADRIIVVLLKLDLKGAVSIKSIIDDCVFQT